MPVCQGQSGFPLLFWNHYVSIPHFLPSLVPQWVWLPIPNVSHLHLIVYFFMIYSTPMFFSPLPEYLVDTAIIPAFIPCTSPYVCSGYSLPYPYLLLCIIWIPAFYLYYQNDYQFRRLPMCLCIIKYPRPGTW